METNRCILRHYKESDALHIFINWASDPEVTKYLTWNTHESIDVTRKVLKFWLQEDKEKETHRFCITLKGHDEPIGAIDIVGNQIGYVLSRKYWNQGIMTEVLNTYTDYLFANGFDELYIRADERNIASNRVITKCGFTFTHKETGPCSRFKTDIVTCNWYKKNKNI